MVFIATTLKSVIKYFKRKAVSSLDEESKWTVRYTAPWCQQENLFLSGSRATCVDDLHCQAKINLKTVLRECDKLRKDGICGSQYYSQGPTFSASNLSDIGLLDHEDADEKSTMSATEEERLVYSVRPRVPLLGESCDRTQTNRGKNLPLPTPEEKMRLQAQSVLTDIIPINVTGENFDRQASLRRSIVNSDTVIRRAKKVKRRKTITGLPDNIEKELGKGDFRDHSLCIPGQYSTLGRVGNLNSALRCSSTRDSSCQTEQVKVVPPSMRRIRSQRAHGVSVLVANFSNSSSGSISAISDSAGVLFTPQLNRGDQHFHSLPRQGACVSLQVESNYARRTPHRSHDCSKSTLPHPLHTDEMVVNLKNTLKTNKLHCPKSQEVRSYQGDQAMEDLACLASSYAISSTLLTTQPPLSSSSEAITIDTVHCSEPGALHMHSVSSYPSDGSLSPDRVKRDEQPPSINLTATPSRYDSAVSLSSGTLTETDSQCSTLDGRKGSYGSPQREEQWIYNYLPRSPLTSSCSTPINHVYSSLECSSCKTDSCSLYSMDNDGYFTSMHLDSGLKSQSYSSINRMSHPRHRMYECKKHHSQENGVSLYRNKSMSRSFSLRKLKKPPLPPARTDSLRRKPEKVPLSDSSVLCETLLPGWQESQQLSLRSNSGSSPAQSPSSDYEDPWLLFHNNETTQTSGVSTDVYSICPITPSQSDSSSLNSNHVESWGNHTDYPGFNTEELRSSDNQYTSADQPPNDFSNSSLLNGPQMSLPHTQDNLVRAKPKTNSKNKKHQLYPSSSYSSQSNTLTSCTRLSSLNKSSVPSAVKIKPKVPERKSSLLSSLSSSSSATLSFNTSGSSQSLPPPTSPVLSGHPTAAPLISTSMLHSTTATRSIQSTMSADEENFPPSTSHVSTEKIHLTCIPSPDFLPPVPEIMLDSDLEIKDTLSLIAPPSPPPLPSSVSGSPLLLDPPMTCQGVEPSLSLKSLIEALNSVDPPAPKNSGESSVTQIPLITAEALQIEQFQPPQYPEKPKNSENELLNPPKAECSQDSLKTLTLEKPSEPESTVILEHTSNLNSTVNGMQTTPTLVRGFLQDLLKESSVHEVTTGGAISSGQIEDPVLQETTCNHTEYPDKPFSTVQHDEDELPIPSPAGTIESTMSMQKHVSLFDRPALSLIMPPPLLEPVSEDECFKFFDAGSITTVKLNEVPVLETMDVQDIPLKLELGDEDEIDSERSAPIADSKESLSIELNSDIFQVHQFHDLIIKEQELIHSDGRSTSDGDTTSSTTGSVSSKDEENDDVFELNTTSFSAGANTNGELLEDMLIPTRARTMDDLFAAIHRSKRKVLGRRDSEEERSRGPAPSPPVTPTGCSPGLASLPRQSGSIQRSLRRSATSSDSFKALLLKKGSRPESSFRMSATEILKCTGPNLKRSHTESSLETPQPDSPCSPLGRGKRAQEEWARSEGSLPRFAPAFSSSHAGTKHGRSRTPPSAASSRYSSRSRIPSSPMTVICEREGELAEAAEFREAPESRTLEEAHISPLLLQDSNCTLCEDGC